MFVSSKIWYDIGEEIDIPAEANADGFWVITDDMLKAFILGGDVPENVEQK